MEHLKKRRLQRKSLWLLFASSLFLQISCSSVQKLDVPICTEVSPLNAYCVNIISGKDFKVSDVEKLEGQTWWEQRHRMVMVPPSSWVKIKAFIIEECKKNTKCSELSNWERSINQIDSSLNNGY